MSLNPIRYAYVATRARGMVANFLRAEDYQQLLKTQNLADFEKVLRKLYPAAAPALHAQCTAPGLEDRITDHYLDIVRRIRRSLPEAERNFLTAITTEYEVGNIKALLRGRILGTARDKVEREMIPMGPSAAMDWPELLAEDEIPELMRILRAHPLGVRIVKAYVEKFLVSHNMYQLDAQIDADYLTWLFDESQKFGPGENRLLRQIIGQRADATNILWILRLKQNFKMAPEEIMVELIPRGYYLTIKGLRDLAFAEDPKLLLAMLRGYPWGKALPAEPSDLSGIEAALDRYLKEKYYGIFRREPLQFAGVVAFVLLARAVAQDAVAILEANEYKLSREEVEPKLFFLNHV